MFLRFSNIRVFISALFLLILCGGCKKEVKPSSAAYHHFKYVAVPSDTTSIYEVSYWFKNATAVSFQQKGSFVYADSIPKTSHVDSIFLHATGSSMSPALFLRVSLKIYVDDIIVREIEGPIGASPRVYQGIAYTF